ncbi:urea amidolyase associated protein UAAP1 [Lacticaseibacillus sp. GG6-2]
MTPIYSEIIRPGEKFSTSFGRNKYLRFTAQGPQANLAINFYNSHDTSERYNMPDSLKAQHTAYLTTGNTVMSDDGRVLASFVADSYGWHDTVTGLTTAALTRAKYGESTYQEYKNDYYTNGYDNFLKELMRSGMTRRDMTANINLFSRVDFQADGKMVYNDAKDSTGTAVTLRLDMDVIVILSNTPNSLNPNPEYPATPILMEVFSGTAADLSDPVVQHSPENYRAYENTWQYQAFTE